MENGSYSIRVVMRDVAGGGGGVCIEVVRDSDLPITFFNAMQFNAMPCTTI